MAKSRAHVTNNGRAAFYAAIWDDLKNTALDCGWALALHGSLNSDMDIMAMPWVEDAKPLEDLIEALKGYFVGNHYTKESYMTLDKPNHRVVTTIPIYGDFYLDINVIDHTLNPRAPKELEKLLEEEGFSKLDLEAVFKDDHKVYLKKDK